VADVQSDYPEHFVRDMACTEAEWLGWLPRALNGHDWRLNGALLTVPVGDGTLSVRWHTLAPRVIALLKLPRLNVEYDFQGVSPEDRAAFMRRFDLYMQRGGG
jgi:hypothetical protein